MSSWKTPPSRPGARSSAGTSMEPRRCRRGKQSGPGDNHVVHANFNGATTMSSWKTASALAEEHWHLVLQWSHDDVVVENIPRRDLALQWSHDDVVVENRDPPRLPELQWSHDDVVVENGPLRGRLQNSGLRCVPREGTPKLGAPPREPFRGRDANWLRAKHCEPREGAAC